MHHVRTFVLFPAAQAAVNGDRRVALRIVARLGDTIIALFKDTSLVIIIGLFDLFSSVQQATVDPAWLGMSTEGYVFAALVYWIFCFSMSRYSQHLEKRFHTGRSAH